MAIDPIATYNARILAKDGFRLSGDENSGIKAMVRYRVDWANVYNFLNAMIEPVNVVRLGQVTYTLPYNLPATVVAIPVYPVGFDVVPMGVRQDLTVSTVLPYQGLAATDPYYQYGIVTINFAQPRRQMDLKDDPNNLQQLDPGNPIIMVEQSVNYSDKMQTQKGHRYRYVSDGKAVDGEFAKPVSGADITLHYPDLPYQPWQYLKPYVNRVNSQTFLLCDPGTILMKSPKTTVKFPLLGSSVPMKQSVILTFKYQEEGWNKLPKPDGTYDDVVKAGGGSIFDTVDFRTLIQQLAYSELT